MIHYVNNYKTKEEYKAYLYSLDLNGKVYQIKTTNKRAKRSLSQNSLMWLWLACIEQETGQSKDELHSFFKSTILGQESRICFGVVYNDTVTTTDLDTLLFKQYLDKIQIFASSELGIILPNPEDKAFEHFKDYYSKFL